MKKRDTLSKEEFSLEEIMEKLSDEELLNVLKKRDFYRSEAVNIAAEVSVRRGVIPSIHHLPPKSDQQKKKSALFPEIDQPKIRQKIQKSLIRSLIILGLIPVLWGISTLTNGRIAEGWAIIIFGAVWEGATLWLLIKQPVKALIVLFALTVVSLLYILPFGLKETAFNLLDWIITGALYLMIIYGLLFIFRTLSNARNNPGDASKSGS